MSAIDFQRHLDYAMGYLGFGMLETANEELDKIEPRLRAHAEVLKIRLEIYFEAKKWSIVVEVARQLSIIQPESPDWPIQLAYATRRVECIEAAKEILLE